MMTLDNTGIKDRLAWEEQGYQLPCFDREKVTAATMENPFWVHFGAGNLFRAFQANVVQRLLNDGVLDRGLVVVEGFDHEIIEKVYTPHDHLSILVTLKADGSVEKTVVGSIVEALALGQGPEHMASFERLKEIFAKDSLQMVSVDGFRISFRKEKLAEAAEEKKVVIPAKTLSEINKILNGEDKEVLLYLTDKHVLFDIDGNIIISRLLEGEYIRYEQSFTEDYKTKFCVNTNDFLQTLERASLVSRDTKKTPVKLDISKEKLSVKAQAEIGTAYEEIEIELEGEPLQIAFNPKFLIDALRVVDDEKVTIQFTTPLSPCILKPLQGENFRYLILPLRL